MNRPIFVGTIGYIIGIILGLYFEISIVLFYIIVIPIVAIYKLKKKYLKKKKREFKIFSLERYFRYIKLIFNSKNLIIIILSSTISNSIVLGKNQKYENIYNNMGECEIIGVIISDEESKEYKNVYKIKVKSINNSTKLNGINFYLNTNKNTHLEYGNIVQLKGTYKEPEDTRNYGGFDYKEYLKQVEIYGTVVANKVEVLKKNDIDNISAQLHRWQMNIKKNAKKYLNKETYPIFIGLILGDTSNIEDRIEEQFRNSSMSHVLAVSGMHISIIVMVCCRLFNKIIGKKKSKIITIIVLILYMLITGFSSSIFRAGTMCIIILLGNLLHRKADTLNSISISLLIILIYNPYLISNLGLQFSYISTLGIIILNKNISKVLENKIKKKRIRDIVSISLSVQIFILPINIFHFNLFNIYFIITNILLSFIIGPTIILCFIFLLLSILNLKILRIFSVFIDIPIHLILLISKISFLPFSKIYLRTPSIYEIVLYYTLVIFVNIIYIVKTKKHPSMSNLRFKYTIDVIKFKFRRINRKIKIVAIILVFSVTMIFKIIPNNLRIHFVDVGQGDCCFIETPNNKTILIDGGGSENSSYDIGKRTLIPYILDRGYTKIDYIIVSHFDSDHVEGLFAVMEELSVGKVIISKQGENSENYPKFKAIIKEKKINVQLVGKGDNIKIENDLYFDILWPNSDKLITENTLNNNSIVCKLYYKSFSMLFTGDIETIAEKEILNEYKNNLPILNSMILKVGHHGSKTSSTKEFIESINPKIALIGVGKDNKFGHPNDEVIERIKDLRSKNI